MTSRRRSLPIAGRRGMPFRIDLLRRLCVAAVACIDDHFGGVPQPEPFLIDPIREEFTDMAGTKVNVYKVTPTAPTPPHDVVKRTFTAIYDAGQGEQRGTPVERGPDDGPFELKVPQGSSFRVELVDSDGKNDSPPRVSAGMTADDQWAPPEPGDFALEAVREEFDDGTVPVTGGATTTASPAPPPAPEAPPEPAPPLGGLPA